MTISTAATDDPVDQLGRDTLLGGRVPRLVVLRVILFALAVPTLISGVWGIVAPEHWFDNYPGLGPNLVAGHPPFNEHLTVDATAGLFSAGVLALVAAMWLRRGVVTVAMIGYLAAFVPHAFFHLFNPSEALSTAGDVLSWALTWAAVIGAVVVLFINRRTPT